jgi:galactokinase
MLQPGIPGTLLLSQVQINHGLTDESPIKFEDRVLTLYLDVVKRFAALHGDNTRCFLMRAPESLELLGMHILEFGGDNVGVGCMETVLCVSPRKDSKINIAHVDAKVPPVEFDLSTALPKTRILDWNAFAAQNRSSDWAAAIKGALLYYVNHHKGPTGQVELNIPGLNIVVGAILPPGATKPSDTTLATAALASAMVASGEWGNIPLSEFATWSVAAQEFGSGRRTNIGPVLFGMPGEAIHGKSNFTFPKGRALPHGHSLLLAHTGLPDDSGIPAFFQKEGGLSAYGAYRATTTQIALAYYHRALSKRVAESSKGLEAVIKDEAVYDLLRTVPLRVTRAQVRAEKFGDSFVKELEARFKTHSEPPEGYFAREKLLFVLAEIQRAARAAGALRSGDVAALASYMNIGQLGETDIYHELSAGGLVEAVRSIPSVCSDEELLSMSEHADALWRQAGRSGASTPETSLLCDLALGVPGVLAARWSSAQRVAILVKHESIQLLTDRLVGAYYSPHNLPQSLVSQIFPCRGVGLVEN